MTVTAAAVSFLVLALGLLVGWFAAAARTRALTQAAAMEAKASTQIEMATLNERVAALGATLAQEREQITTLKSAADQLRVSLENASNELAKQSERALRIPTLEEEIASQAKIIEARDAELRRLSTANGENTEKAAQLHQQLTEAQASTEDVQRKLDTAITALQHTSEAKAALEQQALRVPGLEQQLSQVLGSLNTAKDELTQLKEFSGREISRLAAEVKAERDALTIARRECDDLKTGKAQAETTVAELTDQLTELRTKTDADREHAEERLKLLVEAKDTLTAQFKSLAAEILEEKSKRFAEQNQTSIGQLLEPLKTQLAEFKGKVEEVYVQEGKDRSALSEQVKQLVTLNQTLSQDAQNLTLALKGQAKTQGNWGELILERVLEASGLVKGQHYVVQDSQTREDGSRAQPDVVIELPEARKLVVDAKVSLVAYDRYVSAENDEDRELAVRQHLDSVRAHIRGLSEKRYQQLYGLQSLDFVLAFVPIEPAFMLAVTHDDKLFMDAWERSVLLVSPSTLLFVVRTVAHLWRQDSQSRNTQEIAKRGGELYDKLCGFVADLQKVGDRLTQAKTAYDDAYGKLKSGKGNAIRQAQMLCDLGVKPSKSLPAALVQAAADDEVAPTIEVLTGPPSHAGSQSQIAVT
jgi:DNA recombination protein RmuC